MKVLYIGGTGEVSYGCIEAGLEMGQQISVYNRGTSGVTLPKGVHHIPGDVTDESAYQSVGKQKWDVVCQFRGFDMQQCERDIRAFAGNVGQFVFISTAMVYQRPPLKEPVTESSPRGNPQSPEYAQRKIVIEDKLMELHRSGKMPVTVVRPSHTIRTRMPGTFVNDDEVSWRLVQGKPIICHGDGASLWALTRCEDFGRAFAKLLGNPKAMGEAFHITTDRLHPWDAIYRAWAAVLGAPAPRLVHVASDTLIRYDAKWAGSLQADKTWTIIYDNSKVKSAIGGWDCRYDLQETLAMSAPHVKERLAKFSPDAALAKLLDRIIGEQERLGSSSAGA